MASLIASRGLGRIGTTVTLLVSAGIGTALPAIQAIPVIGSDDTSVVAVVHVDLNSNEIVGIYYVGKVSGFEIRSDADGISCVGKVIGIERCGFAVILDVASAEAGDMVDTSAMLVGATM